MRLKSKEHLIIALDNMTTDEALDMAKLLAGHVWGFKVNDLLVKEGLSIVQKLKQHGNVFVDPKLYDIPNTVANSIKALSDSGADIVTVHASGGSEMLQAASKNSGTTKILAVTVLTSMSRQQCKEIYSEGPDKCVPVFVNLAKEAGVSGVVCSPKEIALVRKLAGKDFTVLTPGIRPSWYKESDDQSRTSTPAGALSEGSDFLVVGRPVCRDQDPIAAVKRIQEEIS